MVRAFSIVVGLAGMAGAVFAYPSFRKDACELWGWGCEEAAEASPTAPAPVDPFPVVPGEPEPTAPAAPKPPIDKLEIGGPFDPLVERRSAPQPRPAPPKEESVYMHVEIGVGEDWRVPPEETVPVIGRRRLRPQWTARPSPRDLRGAYPWRAARDEVEGEASVRCLVQYGGELACHAISQTPRGYDFADKAVDVAEAYRHGPALENGQPSAGHEVTFRVVFRLEPQHPRHQRR